MLALITALAEAGIGVAKLVDQVRGHDEKAKTAAAVAADPAAPPSVKQAAVNVAARSIDAQATAAKQALAAVQTGADAPPVVVPEEQPRRSSAVPLALGLLLLL